MGQESQSSVSQVTPDRAVVMEAVTIRIHRKIVEKIRTKDISISVLYN